MGLAIIGDVHIGIYNAFSKPVSGETLNDRSLASINPLARALQLAKDNAYTLIVNGDLFDSRASLDVRILTKVFELFSRYQDVKCYLIAGNHDQVDNLDIPENSLDMFGIAFKNITVVKTVQAINLSPNITALCVPYSENVKMLKDKIVYYKDHLPTNRVNIMFAHIGVDGASDGGLYTHRLGGAFGLGDLYPNSFTKIYLSHYHRRQHLAPNVSYIGSTQQHNFSDEGQEKGITVLDDDLKESFADLSAYYPKFLTFDTSNKDTEANISKAGGNNYFRVISHSKKEAKEIKKLLPDSGQLEVSLKEKPKEINRLGIKKTDSENEIVTKYVDKHYPKAKKESLSALQEALEERQGS